MLLLFDLWYDEPSGKRSRKISPGELSLGEKAQSGTPESPSTSPASFTGCCKHPTRLWCLYPWVIVLWPQSLTTGGTCSAWCFLCQASSIHIFIVLSKLENFSVIISQKYFHSPILCSFHLYIFFLGVHLGLPPSVQSQSFHLPRPVHCWLCPLYSPHHRLIPEHPAFLSGTHLAELDEALREFVRQKETDTTTQKSGSTQTDEEDPKL